MEFGQQYAEAVIANAKTFAEALDQLGFDVAAKEFGYTESHQVAVNVKKFDGGEKVSISLEMNDIILNMNMLPHEPFNLQSSRWNSNRCAGDDPVRHEKGRDAKNCRVD